MSNIQLSQPGGVGTLTTDGTIEVAARCYLTAFGVTALSWTLTAVPTGSTAVTKLHPKLGWYFDPDVFPGRYTVRLTDTLSATHTNSFDVITQESYHQILDIRDLGAMANVNTAAAAANNVRAIYSAAVKANAAGGGTVYISGIFYLTVPFLVFQSFTNVTFSGDGGQVSQLRAYGSATTDTTSPVDGDPFGFFTFYSPVNCHVTGIGFKGAGVWPPLSTPPTIVSRKAVMFRNPTRCTVTYCYLETIEGESLYCDGAAVCDGVRYDHNYFRHCLSNCTNIGVDSSVGKGCTASYNFIEGLVVSAFQGGGIDIEVVGNIVRGDSGWPIQGGDVFLLVNCTGARLEDNQIFDMDISQSGVSFFCIGDAYGTAGNVPIKHVSVRGNRMHRCKINNTVAGKQGFICMDNELGTTENVVIEGNVIAECTSNGAGAIAIRVKGAGITGKVTVGANTILPASNVTIGIQVDPDVQAGVVNILPGTVFNSVVTSKWSLGSACDTHLAVGDTKFNANLADADVTVSLASGSRFVMREGTMTVNRSITLDTAGAATNEVLEIERRDATANTLAIINGGGGAGTKYTFPVSQKRKARFRFDGTDWQLLEHYAVNG